MSQRARHLLLGLAVGLAVAVLLTLLRGAYTMRALENKTLDARFRAFHDPARADTNIVIVDLDNYSLRLLGPELGRPPWPRDTWRRAVAFLSSGGARAIVFDFAFPEPDLLRPADDSGFAAASREAGTVVQAMTIQAIAGTDSAGIERPIPLLADAARGIGVINFTPDPIDGTLRRTPLRYRVGDRVYPALGVAAVMAADSAVAVPADTAAAIVNWRGPYRDVGSAHPETYRIVPLAAVIKGFDQLRSGETPALDPGTFRGKIVFVGASGSGLFEARANPFGASDPGVLIHATVADNLLHNDFLRSAGTPANVVAIVAVSLAAGLLVAFITSAALSVAAGAGLFLLYLLVAGLLFARAGLWLETAAPAIAIVFTFTGGMALNYVTEGRRKKQIREMFSKYVAPEYVAQLAENPASLNLSGTRAELSILFSDIRGFTSISEKLEPPQVIEFLNEYLTKMAAIVKESGGTLDKFIGDAVMAFWGEPVKRADHAERAADCALAMRDATAALARRWVAEGKPDLRIGIGINTAEVVVGNIGSLEHKLDYTVIGDGVNLASRLEGLNKEHGTTIIISDATRVKLGTRYAVRPLGDVKVKGKEQAVPIFELLGKAGVVVLALGLLAAGPARSQQVQWSDAVYAPGHWVNGRLVSGGPWRDSLGITARVDYFARAPRWRAEIRRTENGQTFAERPDVLVGNGGSVVVLTPVGSTPLDQHALGRDSLARWVASQLDANGRRRGPASGRIASPGRIAFRRAVRGGFDDAILNPGASSGGRNLLASNVRVVGDQRNASVVATAGARGVDRVNTPKGSMPVHPDTAAIKRMEAASVGALALEEFMRAGKIGAYRDSTP